MSKAKRIRIVVPVVIVGVLVLYLYNALKQPEHNLYYGEVSVVSTDVCSTVPGIVSAVNFKEGDPIAVGDIVVSLDDDSAVLALEKAEVALAIASENVTKSMSPVRDEELNIQGNTIEQLTSQREALFESANGLKSSLNQSIIRSGALKESMDLAKESLNRMKALYDSGAESKVALDQASVVYTTAMSNYESALYQTSKLRADLNGINAQMEALDAQIGSAKEQLTALETGFGTRDQRIIKLSEDLASVDLKLAEESVSNHKINSKVSGIVESVNYGIGEYVNPGTPVVTISSSNEMTVTLYIFEKDLQKLSIGTPMTFKWAMDESYVLEGVVKSISSEAMFTPVNVVVFEDRDRLVFEVEVALETIDGIRSGMLLVTDFDELE